MRKKFNGLVKDFVKRFLRERISLVFFISNRPFLSIIFKSISNEENETKHNKTYIFHDVFLFPQ